MPRRPRGVRPEPGAAAAPASGAKTPRPGGMPPWVAWSLYAALGVGILGLVLVFRDVLLPFIIGVLVAYLLAPGVTFLARRGLPRLISVALVYVAFFALCWGFMHYLVPKLQTELRVFARRFQSAPQDVGRFVEASDRWLDAFFGPDGGERASDRAAAQRVLSDHGLGPAAWRAGPPTSIRVPMLDELTAGSALAAGSQLARNLDLSAPGGDSVPDALGESQILATVHGDQIGIKLTDSTVEVREVEDGVYHLAPRHRPVDETLVGPENIRALIRDAVENALHEIGSGLIGAVVTTSRGIATGITGLLVGLVVTLMVAAFVLLDLERIAAYVRGLVPARHQPLYDELLDRLDRGVSGVVRGQLIICAINGVLSGIGFWLFVPEYALVLAVFATVMTLIPIFGTIISTIPACLLALATGGWAPAASVLVWVLVIHFLEANIFNPKIIGASAQINPVIVVFVLIAGEHSYGLKGALLAVPLTAVAIALFQFVFARIRPTLMGAGGARR